MQLTFSQTAVASCRYPTDSQLLRQRAMERAHFILPTLIFTRLSSERAPVWRLLGAGKVQCDCVLQHNNKNLGTAFSLYENISCKSLESLSVLLYDSDSNVACLACIDIPHQARFSNVSSVDHLAKVTVFKGCFSLSLVHHYCSISKRSLQLGNRT